MHALQQFKIVIEPTRRGLRVRTHAYAGDRFADALAECIETALVQFANVDQPDCE